MKLLFVLWKTACSLRVIVLMSEGEAGYILIKIYPEVALKSLFHPAMQPLDII